MATPETIINPNWYADSGASNCVAANPNYLNLKIDYTSTEKVLVGDGSSLSISHIGDSIVPSASSFLKLKNILCVPSITKNLISVSKLAQDNNIVVEFYSDFCVVKDKTTGVELLKSTLKY